MINSIFERDHAGRPRGPGGRGGRGLRGPLRGPGVAGADARRRAALRLPRAAPAGGRPAATSRESRPRPRPGKSRASCATRSREAASSSPTRKAGEARGARYEDFAVLLRSTGNQVHFEKYFRLLDVPYGSENACGLFSEAVACDLYYALRLALYPEDRNALAAYLRSPFAGLSDEAVVRLLCSAADPLDAWGRPRSCPEEDRPGWERGVGHDKALSAMADRAPIAACLSYLWFEAGYRAALLRDPVASAFEEHFELVHSMAVEADARGQASPPSSAELERLVGKPDKLEIDLPRDELAGREDHDDPQEQGPRIPGRDHPPGEQRRARGPRRGCLVLGGAARSRPSGRPAAIGARSRNAFFEAAKEQRTAMERAELKRLLYVALTRAESHIIVSAVEPEGRGREGPGASAPSSRGPWASSMPLASRLAPRMPYGAGGQARRATPPFGRLTALPSGALVGALARARRGGILRPRGQAAARAPKAALPAAGLRDRTARNGAVGRPSSSDRARQPPSPSAPSRSAMPRSAPARKAAVGAAEPLRSTRELAAPEGLAPSSGAASSTPSSNRAWGPRDRARSLPASLLRAPRVGPGRRGSGCAARDRDGQSASPRSS